jgi:hypothetical protein
VSLLRNNKGKQATEVRIHDRHVVVVPCRVTTDSQGLGALHGQDAFVHNLSRGGIGLLVTEPRTRDDLIEIKFSIGPDVVHVCGVVIFCRYIEGNVHEVGVQLHERGDGPLLSALTAAEKSGPAWFLTARAKLRAARGEKKRSA